jgi:3'(2'), 5'-bisphosphate nucleotidase
MQLPSDLLNDIILLARKAGEAILSIYQQPNYLDLAQIQIKSDNSPVTQADKLAHDIIFAGLVECNHRYDLKAYIVSEEDESTHQSTKKINRLEASLIWLVDPLDGTKEFIANTHEFTVNIALIYNHEPILGVIYVPYYDLLYYAQKGQGAFLQRSEVSHAQQLMIPVSDLNRAQPIRVISSRRHGVEALNSILSRFYSYQMSYLGSSWKLCQIAEGKADIYPRLGPTSEWDTAAGQIILTEAGGVIWDLTGKPLCYNTKKNLTNPQFIAACQPTLFTKTCG